MAKAKKDKLRVALIGAGGIAGTHMRYYRDMDDVQMVAAADLMAESVRNRCEEFEIPEAYTDYKKMLRQVKPDAVSVCTPNGLHAPCAIAALNAGAHVIVEKPLAMNAREGQRMLDAAKKNRRKLVIGFQHRYEPRTQFIKKAVDNGDLGKILYGRVQALRRRGIPNWGVFGRKDLQGGGPLIDIGVHVLETTHYVMGSPRPVAASGSTYTYLGNKPSNVLSQWQHWDHKTYTVGADSFCNRCNVEYRIEFCCTYRKERVEFHPDGREGWCDLGSTGVIYRLKRSYGQYQTRLAAKRSSSGSFRQEDAQFCRSCALWQRDDGSR